MILNKIELQFGARGRINDGNKHSSPGPVFYGSNQNEGRLPNIVRFNVMGEIVQAQLSATIIATPFILATNRSVIPKSVMNTSCPFGWSSAELDANDTNKAQNIIKCFDLFTKYALSH